MFSLLLLSVTLVGCDKKSASKAAAPTENSEVPRHIASKGLLLPDVTRQSLGLETVEVAEQKVSASVDFQVRVFKVVETNALASAMVAPRLAESLQMDQWVQVLGPSGEVATGAITDIRDEVGKTGGFVEVIVQISSPPRAIKPGDFLKAIVSRNTSEPVATVPREALLECSDGPFVYTVNGDAFLRTPVKIGAANDKIVEIKDGLFSGDLVALRPVMSLWLMELAATKGGQACCIEPPKGK